MRFCRRSLVLLLTVSALIPASFFAYAKEKKSKPVNAAVAASQMDESKRALHALNRLTFGPRPGDLEKVQAMGVNNWIEQQRQIMRTLLTQLTVPLTQLPERVDGLQAELKKRTVELGEARAQLAEGQIDQLIEQLTV